MPKPSYDIWEERYGEHSYSAASVYGAINAAAKMAKELKVDTPIFEVWLKTADSIKKNIEEKVWGANFLVILKQSIPIPL